MKLKDRVAVVTGGSKGIGKAIAMRLAREKVRLVLAARDPKSLREAAQEIAGSNVYAVRTDVRNVKDIENLARKARSKFGKVDILINNAGIGRFAEVVQMSDRDFRDTLETNLFGVFYCTRAFLPGMMEQKRGHIVNISSLAGKNSFVAGSAYCASKHALIAFSECLMLEVRHHNIKVTTICPGTVQTGFSSATKDKSWAVQPDDVAEAVLDVLSGSAGSLVSMVDLRPLRPPRKK